MPVLEIAAADLVFVLEHAALLKPHLPLQLHLQVVVALVVRKRRLRLVPPTGIAMALGYSTGWLDVLVSDARALGLGALELKVRPLAQHGSKAAG